MHTGDGHRAVARDSLSFFASTVGQAALAFVFVAAVARVAGPAGRGALAFLMAAPTLLHFASTMGLETANLYFAGRDPSAHSTLATSSLTVGLCAGTVAAAGAWLLFDAFPGWVPARAAGGRLAVALALTPLMAAHFLLVSTLVGCGHVAAANRARVAIPAVALAAYGASVGVLGKAGVVSAIVSWAAGYAVGFAMTLVSSARRVGLAGPGRTWAAVPAYLRYGLSLHAGNLANVAVFRVDTLILAASRSAREVGLYAAAVNIAEVLLYLPTAVGNVLLPASAAGDDAAAGRLARRALAGVVAVTAAAAAAGVVLAPLLLQVMFGEPFVAATAPLRIVLVAVVGMAVRRLLWAVLAARARQTTATLVALASLAAVVALDALLIPDHGALGAAWASLGAYWFGGLLMLAAFSRLHPSGASGPDRGLRRDLAAALSAAARSVGRRGRADDEPPPPAARR